MVKMRKPAPVRCGRLLLPGWLLLVALIAVAAGCRRTGASLAGKGFAVILPAANDGYFEQIVAEMTARGERQGVTVAVYRPEEESQASRIRDQVARRVGVLAVAPLPDPDVAQALREASDAGVRIILIEGGLPNFTPPVQAGAHNELSGQLCADYLGQQLGGGGEVAIVEDPTTPANEARVSAFRAWLAERYPAVKIVASASATRPAEAATHVERWLAGHPRLRGIFLVRDRHAGAVARVLADRPQVLLVGCEGASQAVRLLSERGRRAMFVAHYPREIGRMVWRAARHLLRGEPPPDGAIVRVEVQPLVAENRTSFQSWQSDAEPPLTPGVPWKSELRIERSTTPRAGGG